MKKLFTVTHAVPRSSQWILSLLNAFNGNSNEKMHENIIAAISFKNSKLAPTPSEILLPSYPYKLTFSQTHGHKKYQFLLYQESIQINSDLKISVVPIGAKESSDHFGNFSLCRPHPSHSGRERSVRNDATEQVIVCLRVISIITYPE